MHIDVEDVSPQEIKRNEEIKSMLVYLYRDGFFSVHVLSDTHDDRWGICDRSHDVVVESYSYGCISEGISMIIRSTAEILVHIERPYKTLYVLRRIAKYVIFVARPLSRIQVLRIPESKKTTSTHWIARIYSRVPWTFAHVQRWRRNQLHCYGLCLHPDLD